LWTLYAPIFNDRGDLIAIMGVPYTDKSFDFRREALFHAAMIVNLFLLLLHIHRLLWWLFCFPTESLILTMHNYLYLCLLLLSTKGAENK
jgi:hypothetical protein